MAKVAAYKVHNEAVNKEIAPLLERIIELNKIIEKSSEEWSEFIDLTHKVSELRKKLK